MGRQYHQATLAACFATALLSQWCISEAIGLPPTLSTIGRRLEQFSSFPPAGYLQQVPGPGDIGHNSAAAQPQCRAFWDQDAGVTCFINLVWLASLYYQPTSLYGRAMLFIAARQAACNRHADLDSCLADRDNFCAPVTSPLIGFDCVVAADWDFAFEGLFNQGGAFGCPGSWVWRQVRCRSMHKLIWYNPNVTAAGAAALCAAQGCFYDSDFDDCWSNETMPVQRQQQMGDCPLSQYWLRQLRSVLESRSYTSCPYQTGYFDAINRQCLVSIDSARAAELDDLVALAVQIEQGNCVRQGLCAAKCEDYGNWTESDTQQTTQTAVTDVEALLQYRELDLAGLCERGAGHSTPPPFMAAAAWAILACFACWALAGLA